MQQVLEHTGVGLTRSRVCWPHAANRWTCLEWWCWRSSRPLGSGTVRDLLLGSKPAFCMASSEYLLNAFSTALATFFVVHLR